MYLKEIKDKYVYDSLESGSCMNCGLVPKFKAEQIKNGVTISIVFDDNPGWTFVVNKEKKEMTDCYCPVCTRKMKLLKLKKRI